MTTVPKPTSLANIYTCSYDSWNRLTEIKSGDNVVARYEYDGLNPPLTWGSRKGGQTFAWEPVDHQVDCLPSGPTILQRTFPLPGLVQRRELLEVDQLYGQTRLGCPDPAGAMLGQTPDQVVRASVVAASVAAQQDIYVSLHDVTQDTARTTPPVKGRRVKKHVDTSAPGSPDGDIDEYRHSYYNNRWQVLETRVTDDVNDAPDGAKPKYQYIWSLRYIDAPILRDENTDADGECTDVDDERLYFLTDANMNVTTLVDTSGDPAERYVYDAYGRATIYAPGWSERSTSAYGNATLFAGYFRDGETELYHVRNRYYHPALGRWAQRDPAAYTDGMSLYEYVKSAPTTQKDPRGLFAGLEQANKHWAHHEIIYDCMANGMTREQCQANVDEFYENAEWQRQQMRHQPLLCGGKVYKKMDRRCCGDCTTGTICPNGDMDCCFGTMCGKRKLFWQLAGYKSVHDCARSIVLGMPDADSDTGPEWMIPPAVGTLSGLSGAVVSKAAASVTGYAAIAAELLSIAISYVQCNVSECVPVVNAGATPPS